MKKCLVIFILAVSNAFATYCPQLDKTVICHAGSVHNPNYVNICVDFASLWGHFAHHEMDFYGECPTQSKAPYACNAGLKHETPSTTICHKKDTNELVDNCDDSTNCVCSYAGDHQNLTDYMSFNSVNKLTNDSERKLTQAGRFEYAMAYDKSDFGNYEIATESLSFNFGSERIGSEYFLDLCIETPLASNDNREIITSLILDNSVLSRSNYITQTDLRVKTSIFCSNDTELPWNTYTSLISESSFNYYPTGGIYLTPSIPKNNLCILRYTFLENSSLPYLRNWLHSNVKATALLDTQEDDTTDTGPIEICHVKKVSNKNYQCQNLSFASGEDYIQYILTYNNVAAWRQDHQHDYRGRCQSVCAPLNRL